jgi:hypothetical protein
MNGLAVSIMYQPLNQSYNMLAIGSIMCLAIIMRKQKSTRVLKSEVK